MKNKNPLYIGRNICSFSYHLNNSIIRYDRQLKHFRFHLKQSLRNSNAILLFYLAFVITYIFAIMLNRYNGVIIEISQEEISYCISCRCIGGNSRCTHNSCRNYGRSDPSSCGFDKRIIDAALVLYELFPFLFR